MQLLNAYARARVWDEALFHRVSQTIRAVRSRDVPAQVLVYPDVS
jgi:hypothetical protein